MMGFALILYSEMPLTDDLCLPGIFLAGVGVRNRAPRDVASILTVRWPRAARQFPLWRAGIADINTLFSPTTISAEAGRELIDPQCDAWRQLRIRPRRATRRRSIAWSSNGSARLSAAASCLRGHRGATSAPAPPRLMGACCRIGFGISVLAFFVAGLAHGAGQSVAIMGVLSVAAGVRTLLQEGGHELIKQYRFMVRIFSAAGVA
jgi:hypothetical protein